MNTFLNIIAWVIAPTSSLIFLIYLRAGVRWQMKDQFEKLYEIQRGNNGHISDGMVFRPFLLAVASWAWIITQPLS